MKVTKILPTVAMAAGMFASVPVTAFAADEVADGSLESSESSKSSSESSDSSKSSDSSSSKSSDSSSSKSSDSSSSKSSDSSSSKSSDSSSSDSSKSSDSSSSDSSKSSDSSSSDSSKSSDSSSSNSSSEAPSGSEDVPIEQTDLGEFPKEGVVTEQNVHVRKVEQTTGSLKVGDKISGLKGVNGAKFKVYDITDVLEAELHDRLDGIKIKAGDKLNSSANSSSKSESSSVSSEDSVEAVGDEDKIQQVMADKDSVLSAVQTRALKQDISHYKVVASGTTSNYNGQTGVFTFKAPYKEHEYHAYLIVDETKEVAGGHTQAQPTAIMTPITNDDGTVKQDVWMYPKSKPIPVPAKKGTPVTPAKENVVTTVKVTQTGSKSSFINWILNLFN